MLVLPIIIAMSLCHPVCKTKQHSSSKIKCSSHKIKMLQIPFTPNLCVCCHFFAISNSNQKCLKVMKCVTGHFDIERCLN